MLQRDSRDLKVLLVEDFEDTRLFMRLELEEQGFIVFEAENGQIAVETAGREKPDVILMDEPCSALDPRATLQIEELMMELKERYTILIVTHNMQQAARVSDRTAFFMLGKLVEYDETRTIFMTPKEKLTEDYITGRFG